ncbi:S8 family serine peptidase [Streptomyces sp. NPDC058880]|uniref:S8 family serine peptidase n=1 Tax=Streptomyces sp. NPDC058880 TaxID=3346666 RepID=UPI0036C293B4
MEWPLPRRCSTPRARLTHAASTPHPARESVSCACSPASPPPPCSPSSRWRSAPHVTGVAALYKAAHPNARPAEVANFLRNEATEDVIQNLSDNGPDKLLFTGGL